MIKRIYSVFALRRIIVIYLFFLSTLLVHVQAQDSLLQKTDTLKIDALSDSLLKKTRMPDSAEYIYSGAIQDFLRSCDSVRSVLMLDSQWALKIITQDELMQYYHEDFADLLWQVSGLYVHDQGSFGKPVSASMNGLSNERLLVLFDGIPMNDPDVSWTNLNLISLEQIERIEVYSGNYSALYGTSASAGLINIVSRKNPSGKPLTSIKFRSVFSEFQDIGVYFGRNLAPGLQISAGGSYKETPGEQNVQGFSGGYLQNVQRTRYKASQLNAGLQYQINRRWSFGFLTLRNASRFDAYGPNRYGDKSVYSFLSRGGLRKDDRTDYHFQLHRMDTVSLMETRLYFINAERQSKSFSFGYIPARYPVQLAGLSASYGRTFWRQYWQAGGCYEQRTIEDTRTPCPMVKSGRTWVSDRFDLFRFKAELTAGIDWDSRGGAVWNGSGIITRKINQNVFLYYNGGITHNRSSLNDNLYDDENSNSISGLMPLPGRFVINPDTVLLQFRERIYTNALHMRISDVAGLNRLRIGGYYNYYKNPSYFYPLNFGSDTLRLIRNSRGHAVNYGLNAEAIKNVYIFSFMIRPAVSYGSETVRFGVPDFYAQLQGSARYSFFNDNLKLYGHLSAFYFSSHPGYSFQDAPQMYYYAPRSSNGGWICTARVSAYIGDLQLFYEAENILRSRFTLMDGYNITPQQWRFGVIWKLYN